MRLEWLCPRCKASANAHGAGGEEKCDSLRYESGSCSGFICECADDTPESHGVTFVDPCENANCYHCGWSGTFPVKPKGLQVWERKALEAGWSMPESRKEELKLKDVQ